MKKRIFLPVSLILFTMLGISASLKAQITWNYSQSVHNVDFYYCISTCGDEKVVFLKFVNNNAQNVSAGWKEIFSTQTEQGVPGYKGRKQVTLSPGITMQTDCESSSCTSCIARAKEEVPLYPAIINAFEFSDINVN